jgi:hypothetical protein
MTEYVRLEWLGDGSLPIFPFEGQLHYMTGGDDDRVNSSLRWHPAIYQGKAVIPMIGTSLSGFLAFLEAPAEVDGDTLYISIRTYARLELPAVADDPTAGRRWIDDLILACAIVPGQIEGAVERCWRLESLQQFASLCTLNTAEKEPEDPILKAAWHQLAGAREHHRQYKLVRNRARKLLESQLNPDQLDEFHQKHRFRVAGSDGLVYLVTYESHGNVWQVDDGPDGKVILRRNYCHVPTEDVPIYDQMLAQKLLIEHDLESFKTTANMAVVEDKRET